MKYPFFCYHKSKHNLWFRIFGYGLTFKGREMSFSERNGYRSYLKLAGRWRVSFLKPTQ